MENRSRPNSPKPLAQARRSQAERRADRELAPGRLDRRRSGRHHRHRLELGPPRRLRAAGALADAALQREGAVRPRPRHRDARPPRSRRRSPRRWPRIRRFRALADADARRRRSTCSPRPRRARPRTARDFIAAVEAIAGRPGRCSCPAPRKRACRRSASSPASTSPTASSATSAAAASSWSTSAGGEIGAGETFPLGGLRLEEASEKSLKKAEKIVAEALARSTVLAQGREARRSTRSAAPGARSPGCTCARRAIRSTSCTSTRSRPARRRTSAAWSPGATSTRSNSIEVVSRNRRPLLPYGAVVLEQVIKAMRPSEIVMSALGVREGLLYDLLAAGGEGARPADRRLRGTRLSALALAAPRRANWCRGRRACSRRSASTRPREEARLRHAACLLADIGWRAHPGISRRAEPQPHRPRRLHRHRSSRPRLSRARQFLSPRGPDRRAAVAAHPRTGARRATWNGPAPSARRSASPT